MFLVLRDGSENSKFSQFQIFPKLGMRGGVLKFQIFPKFKKVQFILGEGGTRKLWTFSTFWDIFSFECFPKIALFSISSAYHPNPTQNYFRLRTYLINFSLGWNPFLIPLAILGPPGGHFGFLRFSKKELSNQKTYFTKVVQGVYEPSFDLFPDPIGHFEAGRCWRCRWCGVAGSERVPHSPLAGIFIAKLSVNFNSNFNLEIA